MDIHIWDGNIKMDIKDTSFIFRHNSLLHPLVKRDFWESY